jgi:hypothetical protein
MRIKAFGKKSTELLQRYQKKDSFTPYTPARVARVEKAISTDPIYPLIHEIILAEKNAGNLKKN